MTAYNFNCCVHDATVYGCILKVMIRDENTRTVSKLWKFGTDSMNRTLIYIQKFHAQYTLANICDTYATVALACSCIVLV